MASFYATSTTTSSISVIVSGMDSSFSRTRYFRWYRNGSLVSTTTSSPYDSSKSYTYSGLSAGTTYSLMVKIYDSDNSTLFSTLSTSASTSAASPVISSFTVAQTSVGAYTARCSWSGSNIASGSSYTISVSGRTKASGYTSGSGSVNITLDYFQQYTATLQITSSGKTVSKSCTFTMTAPVIPALSSFYVSAVSGTLKVNCSWGINNNKSSVTTEVRANTSSPTNYQTSGYQKGYYSYTTNSSTITFDKSGTFYVWINLFNNGEYIGTIIKTVTTSLSKPSLWYWTQAESNAFANKGDITTLTRTRWNEFLSQINLAISFCNSAKGSGLSAIASGEMMSSDKVMYAVSFSAICQKLNSLCSSYGVTGCGISSVSVGGTIYGYYFTNLSAALNRAINTM